LSQTPPIKLDSVFQAPIVRAQFDVLLVLADAMSPLLPDLYQVAGNWQRVVAAAAEALANQTAKVRTVADAIPIWNRVLIDLDVARLTPAAAAVLDSITKRLQAAVLIPYDGEDRLAAMHDAAVSWIRDLGVRRGLADLQQTRQYPLRAHYDPEGNDYCASSSLFADEIGWNLQLVERSLYGVLILDMLFEHEYLSHMLPRNSFLSKSVREIWLSTALYWELKSLPGNRAMKKVQEFLWEKFRRELGRHFDPKDLEFFGPLEIDNLARDIYSSSPEIFWDITKAILECADTRKNADLVDGLFQQLLYLTPDELRARLDLAPTEWDILQRFHEMLDK
jgi:hypothetical protein